MKKVFTIIIFTLFVLPFWALAQEFKNEGDHEDYETKKVFSEQYVKYNIKRFQGHIVVLNKTEIKYDSTVLKVYTENSYLRQIFTSGVFYPAVFSQETPNRSVIGQISNSQDSTSKDTSLNDLFEHDTLSISNIEELNYLNPSPTVKRLKFWVWHRWLLNPTIYFIELTNENAIINSDFLTFLKDAKITFIKKGWLII